MTTFSDPGFRVTGPGDEPTDDVEVTDLDELEDESELGEQPDSELHDKSDDDAELEDLDSEFEEPDSTFDELDAEAEHDAALIIELLEDDQDLELLEDDQDTGHDVDVDVEPEFEEDADAAEVAADSDVEIHIVKAATTGELVEQPPFWSAGQLIAVGRRALAVLVAMAILGYALGAMRGNSYVARTEFVYTLDESVPDSFLREDRRLLTQVVTFKSDAVLTPVAQEFELTVDELRAKIEVETLELSEVLRFDVSDADEDRAIALSQAVLNQYLQVITDASPAGDSTAELAQRRADVVAELAAVDDDRENLVEAQQRDIALQVREESIQRQINLRNDQLSRFQESLDAALTGSLSTAERTELTEQYEATLLLIGDLEADLVDAGSERAALANQTTAGPALLREIDRLETVLTTIDDELSQRELAPLVASPIRELSDPIILFQSRNVFGLQGMALGLLIGFPIAGFIGYRTRKQQLWFD